MSKQHSELATKIMNLLLAEGLSEKLTKTTTPECGDYVQTITETFNMVSARVVTSYLLRALQDGNSNEAVAAQADDIVRLVGNHFDYCLTSEVATAVEILNDLVDTEWQTNH